MNAEAKEKLERLLSQEENTLTQTDKDFISARASYLTANQLSRYSFLSQEQAKPQPVSQVVNQGPQPQVGPATEDVEAPKQVSTAQPQPPVQVVNQGPQPQGIDTTK